MENRVDIRELKARLSAYLRKVRSGETVVVTDRGEPVAHVPVGRNVGEIVRDLVDAGLVDWDGRSLEPREPIARARGGKTAAEILLESRGRTD